MANTKEENEGIVAPPFQPRLARFAGTAGLLAGTAILLAALVLAGSVAAGPAVLILLGVAILALALPRPGVTAGGVSRAEETATTWPETGAKLFAEALPDPCFIVDLRGIVRYANQRALDAFGISPGSPLTSRLRVPTVLAAFDRIVATGRPERVEFTERVPTERWFAGWFARLDGPAGSFVVFIVDDVTERRRAERIRVDFVANASHELRTPLASLAGFVETLQGPARDDPVARERFLQIMREQAMRMARLVDDLLSLSRVELKAHLRPEGQIDLVVVARHVIDALEPLARELGVKIEPALPRGPVMVAGDRDGLIEVFENLIENACKYGRSGGRVVVTLTPAAGGKGPMAVVRDFGPGIAEEHIPRLTERFYRVEAEESRKHRGTGLGLAIVKHILARHGARLAVDSRLGEGTSFTVIFPQA